MEYIFLRNPDPATIRQIIALYQEALWWSPSSDSEGMVRRIVDGSHCFVVAREEGVIIGMGRAISDGVSDAYLQDITVKPSQRGHVVGRGLVHRLLERLHADGIGWVALIADGGATALYKKEGFINMENATPMWLRDTAHGTETSQN